MTKRWLIALAALLALPALALQVTDDRGATITLPEPPRRIVSLLPSLTETVCTLDRCDRLVGVDRYSNWPESVRRLPQVGGALDPSVEAIAALRPDLVLAGTSMRATARLEALGIRVMALEPKRHADVQRVLQKLGTVLQVADTQRVWRAIDAGISAAQQSLPPSARGMRVYFEVNSGPYAAGTSSFIGETLARLGVRNIVPAELGPFPRLNPEFVVRADPDVILIGARNAQALDQRPGWPQMRALRQRQVCVFPPDEADVLVRPGPRMAEAARLMARCLGERAARASGARTAG